MMYKTVVRFKDLQDGNHLYNVGDKFPHDDRKVAKKRLTELSTAKNRRGIPLIEEVKENVDSDMSGDKELVRQKSSKMAR